MLSKKQEETWALYKVIEYSKIKRKMNDSFLSLLLYNLQKQNILYALSH